MKDGGADLARPARQGQQPEGKDRLLAVSSDGHIGAPLSVYRQYIEKRYLDEYDQWLARHKEVEHTFLTTGYATREMPGRRRPFLSGDPATGITVEELVDPDIRMGILKNEGTVAEVLFPGPDFGRQAGYPFAKLGDMAGSLFNPDPAQRDMELVAAGDRAYNRFLADYCSKARGRAVGLIHPPLHDMEAATAEARRGREAGLLGIQLPSDDPRIPPYWDDRWEPFWNVCEELELSVNFHGGTALGDKALPLGKPELRNAMITLETPFWCSRPLKVLVYGGVLERHPGLKVVFTEFTSDWVPAILARMELMHRDLSLHAAVDPLPRPPSEYWYRQCYVGASLLSRDEVGLCHNIGVNNMMFGTDYPHPEGSWGRTREWYQQVFGNAGLAEDELRKIVGLNAVEVYGLDRRQLQPIANRVGFRVEEILNAEPQPREAWGSVFEYMPAPYRKASWSQHDLERTESNMTWRSAVQ